jgi:hypothetical protein
MEMIEKRRGCNAMTVSGIDRQKRISEKWRKAYDGKLRNYKESGHATI